MGNYFHSVRLDAEKCKGCTNCIRRCPTEAIRVRDGRAQIIEERCIDCGECIRVCPNQAKLAISDTREKLKQFKHAIALPAPALYGQFKGKVSIGRIDAALLRLGFADVFQVAYAADLISYSTDQYMARITSPRPLISQACPAVVSLIQVRFPLLLNHLIPIDSPMNAAARMAKDEAMAKGYLLEDVGVFFITPCPAKITAIRQPQKHFINYVDGVLAIRDVYGDLRQGLDREGRELPIRATAAGINWGRAGGEARAMTRGTTLSVDGIHNVISVLEEVEMGHLTEIDYLECQACVGGCVGGALTFANPHLARMHLKNLASAVDVADRDLRSKNRLLRRYDDFKIGNNIMPRRPFSLDQDVARAITKLEMLEKTLEALPGLDCGSCGAPTCRALAEDIVRGLSSETDCVFKLRERVSKLAREVMELASLVPPSMSGTREPKSKEEDEAKNGTGHDSEVPELGTGGER
ncbi:MAG TPA: 4Fe-4S binding protein [Clostridia bacterium]|nr:4Fe-4S binding protein [Clostridia bacterium]